MAMKTQFFVALLLLTTITAATPPPSQSPLPTSPPSQSPLPTTPPSQSPLPTSPLPPKIQENRVPQSLLPNPTVTSQPPPLGFQENQLPQSPLPNPTASSPPSEIQENQLKNIIDALIGAGDFGGWANILSAADSSALPVSATLFIPSDDAAAHSTDAGISFDPFLIPYHISIRRLTFSDLTQLAIGTRIPTLLPSKFIIITNNSASNFTVDSSQITEADIFSNSAFAVHGINNVLDYSTYGAAAASPPPENPTAADLPETSLTPRKRGKPICPEDIDGGVRSGAAALGGGGVWSVVWIMFCFITL